MESSAVKAGAGEECLGKIKSEASWRVKATTSITKKKEHKSDKRQVINNKEEEEEEEE